MSRKLRVLVLTPDFPPDVGGIQLMAHRLVTSWPTCETLVLTTGPSTAAQQEVFPGGTVRRITLRGGRPAPIRISLLMPRAVAEALRFRPDVVLCSHIVLSPAAWAISRLMGTPYLQQLYGMEVSARPRLARFAVRHAVAVTAISAYAASLVPDQPAHAAIHLIPPGVDPPAVRRHPPSDQPVVLTVARMAERYKGHDVMLRAMPLVRARVPDVRWIAIGDGPFRGGYEQMARSLGLSDCVRFLGAVDDEERNRWLDTAQVFAMPSRLSTTGGGEGFGIVYMEAAARQLPVVAGNVGGALDAVLDGVTGLLVDPTDHLAVADAITGLLIDRDRSRAFGLAGSIRAQQFSWTRTADRFEGLLRQVAKVRAA